MAELPSLGPRVGRPQGPELIDDRLQKVTEDLRKKRDAELGITIIRSNPEKTGRANVLARKSGVPAPLVEGDMEAFEARDRAARFRLLVTQDESLARWAGNDRRNAAAASDDTESLGALGQVWRQARNIGSSLKAGFYSGSAGIYEVGGALIGGVADRVASGFEDPNGISNRLGLGDVDRAIFAPIASGLRSLQSSAEGAAATTRGMAEDVRPEGSFIEESLYAGFESIPTTVAGVLTGVVTRNPGAAAGIMGVSVAGNEYREALNKGLNPGRAARYALGQGSVEYLTERIPASRLIGDLASKSPLAKTFMRQLTAELPGEQVATIIQDLNEWVTLNPEKPFMDYVRERPRAAVQTALATISGVGGTVAVTKAAEKTATAGAKVADRVAKSQAAKREGKVLDDLAEATNTSKLKQRDPEAFAGLIRTMGGDAGVSHVFVDAEAAREFMQSDDYDGSLDPWTSDIQDAAIAGGDFAIGIEDALTELAGTPAWEKLRPDMRLSPGGMSPREAEAFDPGEAMQSLSDAAPATTDDPRVNLFESISTKLMDAGFTPTTARVQAELLASRYATRAERMGVELTGDEFGQVEVRSVTGEEATTGTPEMAEAPVTKKATAAPKPTRAVDSMARERTGTDVITFIRKKGGIRDDAGHDLSRGRGYVKRPGLINKRGRGVDDMGELLWEAGYFGEGVERPSEAEVLDLIERGFNEKVYAPKDQGVEARNVDALENGARDQLQEAAETFQMEPTAPVVPIEMTPEIEDMALEFFAEGYSPMEAVFAAWEFSLAHGTADVLDDIAAEGVKGHDYEGAANRLRESAEGIRDSSEQGARDENYVPGFDDARDRSLGQSPEISGGDRSLNQLFDEPAQPEQSMTQAQRAELEARQQQSMARRGGQEAVSDQEGGLFSAERDQRSLFDGPRGRIVFPEGQFTGSARIELFKARNLSTLVHESGHLFLEELRFDAEATTQTDGNEAARQLFADWEAVKAWFKSNGHEIGDEIPTEAHELWARGFERYLMEGKSPNQSLRRAFETFKSWLVNIYRSTLRLDAPITDEIRGVMSRLIATDTEIAEAAEQQEIELIFSSAVEAGMSESAFRALQESAQGARAEAHDELLKRVMAPIRARVTQEYKDREKPIREEVTEGIDNRPVFRALRLLRDTPMDSGWLEERGVEGLPPQVPPVSKRDGANPADIAERAGFKSPEEMIDALKALEVERQKLRANDDKRSVRAAIIDTEVESIMNSRYGDPFTDGSIEEEALALIHNDAHGEVMAAELRALGRQTGKKATTYRLARNWARERVRTGSVNETTSRSAIQRYQRSAARAGKAAMDAMIAGDRDEAFRHKQSQMIHNALVAEAKAALDDVEAAVSRMERLAKRRTLKSTDQDYLERAQVLLEAVELRERSQISIDRQGQFEAWARDQEANGIDVVVPASFEASLGTTHWSRLTVEKLLGLDAATRQIMHLGRTKQKLLDAKEQRDFDEMVEAAQDGLAGTPKKPVAELMEPGWFDAAKAYVLSFDASLLKMEQVITWLDNGNENGVFDRVVFRPIADAQAREQDMLVEYNDKIKAAFEKIGRKGLARWNEPFVDPALVNRETGQPWQNMKRQHLIAMALNTGNEGNIQRLTDGYGWNESAVREVLNRELTAEEWTFVQEIWDTIDGLWPQIAEMERRVNGIAPDKVEAVPVETPHGIFRGGYYPAIYDSSKDYDAERQSDKASDLFEMKYTRATTRASATKERADRVSRPISLQLGVINRHVQEVIHDVTHREPVMQAHKFLSDARIKRLVDETLGPEYRRQFQPWLKYVANQWAMDRAGNEGFMRWANSLRANTTVVGMGFRFSTIIQQFAGLSNSVEKVGAKWLFPAMARAAAHPVETFDFVMERSGELRHRMDTIERDINQTIKNLAGKPGGLTAAKRFAFHGIGYTDRIVSVPTWMAGYSKAVEAGLSEADAISAGDKAVRLSQGAAGAKDLPAIARGTGNAGLMLKYMTMFYTYVSTVYSRQRNLGRDVRHARPRDVPALMARAWWLVVLPPMLAELLSMRAPEEDEDWGMWAFEAITLQSLGAIPILRDAARPVVQRIKGEQAFDYAMSPVQRAIQTFINTAGDAVTILEGEETKKATRNVLESVGYATGLVPGQLAQSAQFLVDVAEGDQKPRDFWDWFEGLTKGKIKED